MDFSRYENIEIFVKTQSFAQINQELCLFGEDKMIPWKSKK